MFSNWSKMRLIADARSIAFCIAKDGDTLTFQHDGRHSLEERDVIGLSKVFQSTKGASSVGFMGIGFKSVFGRFPGGPDIRVGVDIPLRDIPGYR